MPMTAFCLHTAKCMQWKWMNVFAMPTLCVMLVYFCLSFFFCWFFLRKFLHLRNFRWIFFMTNSNVAVSAWRMKNKRSRWMAVAMVVCCVVAFAFMHIVFSFFLCFFFASCSTHLILDCKMSIVKTKHFSEWTHRNDGVGIETETRDKICWMK